MIRVGFVGLLCAGALLAGAACQIEGEAPSVGTTTAAAFDFGADCSTGSGEFTQFVPRNATALVGDIPVRKRNVRIELRASEDVDVQLIDKATGHEIIAWPYGDLSGPTPECTTYRGVQYCYSGYNGDGANLGHEWIEVRGDTNRAVTMRAFGYVAGNADVDYSWAAVDTCNEVGDGTFTQAIPHRATALVGVIPKDKVNVRIDLASSKDVDIQLFDGATALVKWPDGRLNGPREQTLSYGGMMITWSGYNGDGVNKGNEFIRVSGRVTRNLTMKVFGYESGSAQVAYEWGIGAGQVCGGSTPCDAGLTCKAGDSGPRECHTADWCESDASAPADCNGLPHPSVPGSWACEEFVCAWKSIAPCSSNADCGSTQYCDGGQCRDDGTCDAPADCLRSGNDWDSGACLATHRWQATCEATECGYVCIPL